MHESRSAWPTESSTKGADSESLKAMRMTSLSRTDSESVRCASSESLRYSRLLSGTTAISVSFMRGGSRRSASISRALRSIS